ncbi:MAG: LysR family transcriptional regulator [Verrucomicrobia bacterium]|nr:LysR family transcriptional regulator [Verrucomicrobiota bacterium]
MKTPLDSRQLRAFCALARTGSFTQTARELHLTQSGISHSMKALERDVGCRLLHRLGKKIALTQAGEQLLHHSAKILQEMENARESLGHLGKWGRGRLRRDTPELVAALLRHRIDLALTLETNREPQLDFHPLFTDELLFLVSARHPWAKSRQVERAKIPQQNYILYNKKSVTFRLIEEYFRREDMALNTVIELGSMEATKELVKLDLGVSILAPWIARKELEEGSLVALPLGRRKLQRRWGILHWHGKRLNLAEETFIGLCESAKPI